jgi:hypothetical protein
MEHFFLGADRPFDIFHQINMLWQVYSHLEHFPYLKLLSTMPTNSVFCEMLLFDRPGLLGTTKYEFAKTYCDLKYIKGVQGKIFAVILSVRVYIMYGFIWLVVISIF